MVDTIIKHSNDKNFQNAYNSILRTLFACVNAPVTNHLNLALLATKLLAFRAKYDDFEFKSELCNEKNCGYKGSPENFATAIKAAREVLTTLEEKVTANIFPWDAVSDQASEKITLLAESMDSLSKEQGKIGTTINALQLLPNPPPVLETYQTKYYELQNKLTEFHDEFIALMVLPRISQDDYRIAYSKALNALSNYFTDDSNDANEQVFRLQLLSFESDYGPLYVPKYFFEDEAQSFLTDQRQFVIDVLSKKKELIDNAHKNRLFTSAELSDIQNTYARDLEVQEALAKAIAKQRVDTQLDLADKQLVTAFRINRGYGQAWEKYLYPQEGDVTDSPQQRADNLKYILDTFIKKQDAPSDIIVCNSQNQLEELITLTRNSPALMYDLMLETLLKNPKKYNRENNPNVMRILISSLSEESNEFIADIDDDGRKTIPSAVIFNNLLCDQDEKNQDTMNKRYELFNKLIFTKEFCKALTGTQILKMAELDTTGKIAEEVLFASDLSYIKRSGKLTQNGIERLATQYLKTNGDIAKLNARLKKPSLLSRFIAILTGSNFYKHADAIELPNAANPAELNGLDRQANLVVSKTTILFAKAYFSANADVKLAAKLELLKQKNLNLAELNNNVRKLNNNFVSVATERFEADLALVKRIIDPTIIILPSPNSLDNSSEEILAAYYLEKNTPVIRQDILNNHNLCVKLLSTKNQDQAQKLLQDKTTIPALVEVYRGANPAQQNELLHLITSLCETAKATESFRAGILALFSSGNAVAVTSASTNNNTSETQVLTANRAVGLVAQ